MKEIIRFGICSCNGVKIIAEILPTAFKTDKLKIDWNEIK